MGIKPQTTPEDNPKSQRTKTKASLEQRRLMWHLNKSLGLDDVTNRKIVNYPLLTSQVAERYIRKIYPYVFFQNLKYSDYTVVARRLMAETSMFKNSLAIPKKDLPPPKSSAWWKRILRSVGIAWIE